MRTSRVFNSWLEKTTLIIPLGSWLAASLVWEEMSFFCICHSFGTTGINSSRVNPHVTEFENSTWTHRFSIWIAFYFSCFPDFKANSWTCLNPTKMRKKTCTVILSRYKYRWTIFYGLQYYSYSICFRNVISFLGPNILWILGFMNLQINHAASKTENFSQ